MANEKQDERTLERKREKERIRARLTMGISDPIEIEKEMALRYDIALRMMMDQVPDEKIRYYCLLSHMQIEFVRSNLLPKAIKESECKSRAMNESLRR